MFGQVPVVFEEAPIERLDLIVPLEVKIAVIVTMFVVLFWPKIKGSKWR